MPITTKAPTASHVYFLIFLGISSMLITLLVLYHSIKPQPAKGSTNVTDTVWITYKTTAGVDTSMKVPDSRIGFKKEKLLFNRNPDFLVWMSFITLMVAFATTIAPVLWSAVADLGRNFKMTKGTKFKVGLITFIILCLIAFVNSGNSYLLTPIDVIKEFRILFSSPDIVPGIVFYTLAIAMIAVYGQLAINEAISQLPEDRINVNSNNVKAQAAKFLLLRQKLKSFLVCLAALIVFAIITTELLRKAILREIVTKFDIVPANVVYIYGFVFTFFLAILYLPVYYRLRRKGEILLGLDEGATPAKDLEPTLSTFLIKESPLESLKITLSILAPILSTLIPNIKIF